MPQKDRYQERTIPIEFQSHETFENLVLDERMTMVLITNGFASFSFNNETISLKAPSIMLLSPYDKLKLMEQKNLSS